MHAKIQLNVMLFHHLFFLKFIVHVPTADALQTGII